MVESFLVSSESSPWFGIQRLLKSFVISIGSDVFVTLGSLQARVTQKVSVKGDGPVYA